LAVEGAPDVSGAFEDLTELFEILVHVFFFDGVVSFLLGGDFLCTGTTKLDKFSAGSAKRIRPFTRTLRLSYIAGNFVEQVRRRNRTNEGSEYVSWKSVESLKGVEREIL
jgi:hypothetical protein